MRKYIYLIFIFLVPLLCQAQSIDSTLVFIKEKISNGEKSGLKELVLFQGISLSKKKLLLQNFWFSDLNFDNIKSQKELETYFDEQSANLSFSIALGSFYSNPISQKSPHIIIKSASSQIISFEDWSRTFKKYMVNGETEKAAFWVDYLEDFFALKIRKKLMAITQQIIEVDGFVRDKKIWQKLTQKLNEISSIELLTLLPQLLNKELISQEEFNHYYSKILRVPYRMGHINVEEKNMDIVAFHISTYESKYNMHRFFFNSDAEFLMYIGTKMDGDQRAIENLVSDLLLTNDPNILHFIPTLIWRNKDLLPKDVIAKMMTAVEVLTDSALYWNQNKWTSCYIQGELTKNQWQAYIRFWYAYAKEFRYENQSGQFINDKIWRNDFEKYEKLFKRLNASSDSIVMDAYSILAKGNPIQIKKLNEKYKDFLRQTSALVPSLKYRILPILTQLNQLNAQYGVEINKTVLVNNLHVLKDKELEDSKRVAIENEIIAQITLDDVATLEWEALIYIQDKAYNFSLARIINHAYNKYWNDIKLDEKALEYYVLKAEILSHTTLFGFGKNYMHIFEMDKKNLVLLKYLKSVNLDPKINDFMNKTLVAYDKKSNLAAFEAIIKSGDNNDLRRHKIRFDLKDYNAFCQSLSPASVPHLMTYIKYHKDIAWVPTIMYWLDKVEDQKIEQLCIERLEKIYHFKSLGEAKTFWLKKWRLDEKNYINWSSDFRTIQIKEWQEKESISVKDFINFLNVEKSYPAYHEIKESLALKINDFNKIKFIKDKQGFSQSTALKLIDKTEDLTQWMNILKHTNIQKVEVVFRGLYDKINKLEPMTKGLYLHEIMTLPSFSLYMVNEKIDPAFAQKLLEIISAYIEEGDYDDYDESSLLSQQFLFKNAHLSFKDFMIKYWSFYQELDDNDALGELIYAQMNINDYLQVYDALLLQDIGLIKKINKDFGFSLIHYDRQTLTLFKKSLQSKALLEVYKDLLKQWGLNIWDKKGVPDFSKIKNDMLLDHIDTYLGSGGQYRDFYLFTLTQYLASYFKDDLGFSTKLSEGQTFFSYNANKRIKAWLYYLEQNGLADKKINFTLNKLIYSRK